MLGVRMGVTRNQLSVGDTALKAAQTIVHNHPEILVLLLYSWTVHPAFTELFRTETDRRANPEAATRTNGYDLGEQYYQREEFLQLSLKDLPVAWPNQVWGLCSIVRCRDGSKKHIPMMDLDPKEVQLEEIVRTTKVITKDKPAILVGSGAGIHYYGNYLLTQDEWTRFLGVFLLAEGLHDRRYIGHCLNRGFCTLRLTPGTDRKTGIPKVLEIIE